MSARPLSSTIHRPEFVDSFLPPACNLISMTSASFLYGEFSASEECLLIRFLCDALLAQSDIGSFCFILQLLEPMNSAAHSLAKSS